MGSTKIARKPHDDVITCVAKSVCLSLILFGSRKYTHALDYFQLVK